MIYLYNAPSFNAPSTQSIKFMAGSFTNKARAQKINGNKARHLRISGNENY